MSINAKAQFLDGPCAGQIRSIVLDPQPPETLTCRSTTYIIAQGGLVAPETASGLLNYVVKGGKFDSGAAGFAGERDLFRAWHQLGRAWKQDTERELARVKTATNRLRRAVR